MQSKEKETSKVGGRVPKFRAWNKTQHKMGDVEQINFITGYIDTDGFVAESENEEVVLMQYTGLKDKNGKEIYEGDIVQLTHFDGIKDKPEEVKWSAIHDGGEAIGFGYWDFTGYEVIGNIYSNPELLQS